jgi:hypothetical protein
MHLQLIGSNLRLNIIGSNFPAIVDLQSVSKDLGIREGWLIDY